MNRLAPIVSAILAAVLIAGCSGAQSRRDVYMHLMTPEQQAHFQRMEAEQKPASLKLAYLQGIGVYQEWAEVPKDTQQAVLRREVKQGMTPSAVRMALGEPDRIEDATLPDDRAAGRERVIWHYDGTFWKFGSRGARRSICFLGDKVLSFRGG